MKVYYYIIAIFSYSAKENHSFPTHFPKLFVPLQTEIKTIES